MIQQRDAASASIRTQSSSSFSSPPLITVSDPAISPAGGVKKRRPALPDKMQQHRERVESPLLDAASDSATPGETHLTVSAMSFSRRNQWILYALASGACAAFNGVFAKLTTTELTSTFSQWIARLIHLNDIEPAIEFIVRCTFFGLNLVFNGVMWTLFTTALARGNSTTQVSIMNTSSNFFITAILGFAIFSEALPPLWWLGAALLVTGNVIIGQKDEGVAEDAEHPVDAVPASASDEDGLGLYQQVPPVNVLVPGGEEKDDEEAEVEAEVNADEDVPDLGEIDEN